MEQAKEKLIQIWMSNVTERAKRHGLTRDALYKSQYRNVPILTAITADVQDMQKLLAELGIELRSPAKIHTEIRVPGVEAESLVSYLNKLIAMDGKLDAMTTNGIRHRMASFISIANENNMDIGVQIDVDEHGPFIHLSAKEKHTVFL
jgi:hypothetical protein